MPCLYVYYTRFDAIKILSLCRFIRIKTESLLIRRRIRFDALLMQTHIELPANHPNALRRAHRRRGGRTTAAASARYAATAPPPAAPKYARSPVLVRGAIIPRGGRRTVTRNTPDAAHLATLRQRVPCLPLPPVRSAIPGEVWNPPPPFRNLHDPAAPRVTPSALRLSRHDARNGHHAPSVAPSCGPRNRKKQSCISQRQCATGSARR